MMKTFMATLAIIVSFPLGVYVSAGPSVVQEGVARPDSARIDKMVKGLYFTEADRVSDPRPRLNKLTREILRTAHQSLRLRRAVVGALIRTLNDPRAWEGAIPQGWVFAADLLGELKALEALDLIMTELGNPLSPLSVLGGTQPVAIIVAKFGEPAVPKLAIALSSGETTARGAAAAALGMIRGEDAKRALSKALTTESDEWVREAIRKSLERIDEAEK